jgi:hypothetical protein
MNMETDQKHKVFKLQDMANKRKKKALSLFFLKKKSRKVPLHNSTPLPLYLAKREIMNKEKRNFSNQIQKDKDEPTKQI